MVTEEIKTDDGAIDVLVMACGSGECDFKPRRMQRRAPGPDDIQFDLKYSGVCHTDLHIAAGHLNSLSATHYPCVPGHELAGVVTEVGANVTKFSVGDHVGVGCMVDSCLNCQQCNAGREHLCSRQNTATYNGIDKHGRAAVWPPGSHTLGGYTNKMVVHERFAVNVPKSYPLEAAGPVMCSGVTLYEPLMRFAPKESGSKKVAIVGLGGLGVMGIKLGAAMGHEVTAVSRNNKKQTLATSAGATGFVAMDTESDVEAALGSFDLVIDSLPVEHNIKPYLAFLKPDADSKLVLLGITTTWMAAAFGPKVFMRNDVKSSLIGSMKATQEVIDLCSEQNIQPEISVVPVSELNEVYNRLDESNATGVRYVLDIQGTLNEQTFDATVDACESIPPPHISEPESPPSLGGIIGQLFRLMTCCFCCRF